MWTLKYQLKITGTSRIKVQFEKCGHETYITPQSLGKKIPCKDCFNQRVMEQAEAVNLKFIGKADKTLFDANYRLYSCNRCKGKLVLRIEHVKKNSFLCEHCDASPLDDPSRVYLLKIKHPTKEWLKLGFSKHVDLRISTYGLTSDCVVKVMKAIPFDTGFAAKKIELKIHEKYKSYRINSKSMKAFHRWNGHSECYETSAEKYLISALAEFT